MRVINFKTSFIFKFMFLLFFLVAFQDISISQCSSGSNVLETKATPSTAACTNCEVPFVIWVVKDDNGQGGVPTNNEGKVRSVEQARTFFGNLGINLNFCYRPIHNQGLLDTRASRSRIYYDCTIDNAYQLTIFPDWAANSIQGSVGTDIPGISGWSENNSTTIIHEIGHLFGLYHTFQNSGDAHYQDKVDTQSSCLINGEDCLTNPLETGDRMVSTPPDKRNFGDLWDDCDGNISNTAGNDACGTPYSNLLDIDSNTGLVIPDPTNAVNYMSYHSCSNKSFTDEQVDRMKRFIALGFQGTYTCPDPNVPVTPIYAGGPIQDQNIVMTGETLTPFQSYQLIGSNVTLIDCTVNLNRDSGFDLRGSTLTPGSTLTLVRTTIIQSSDEGCESSSFIPPVISSTTGVNTITIEDNSFVEGETPISSSTSTSTSTFTTLDNSTLSSLGKTACSIYNGALTVISGSSVFGAIRMATFAGGQNVSLTIEDSDVYAGDNSSDKSVILVDITSGFGNVKISNSYLEAYNLSFFGLDVVEILDNTRIFHGNKRSIDIKRSDVVTIMDSYIAGYKLDIEGCPKYTITGNDINSGPPVAIETAALNITVDDETTTVNSVEQNIITAPKKGIITKGEQTGATFLCNEFHDCTDANFDWATVAMQQGQSIDSPSGNILTDPDFQITGMSTSIINYNNLRNSPEDLLKFDHNSVIDVNFDQAANCSIIGPVWTGPDGGPCPMGIDCSIPCPMGIDCTVDCPIGVDCTMDCPVTIFTGPGVNIDCTQDCPPGIDCTEPCPQGIDCTEPCPIGVNCEVDCPVTIFTGPGVNIDCTQDCPPGIDCTEPCPQGIDCTEPCPIGVNCEVDCPPGQDCTVPCFFFHPRLGKVPCYEPIGPDPNPDDIDPPSWKRFINKQYDDLANSISGIRNNYKSATSSTYLDNLLESKSTEAVNEVLITLSESPGLLTAERLKSIFDNSELYTEEEVTSVISENPIALYDIGINQIVFGSESFTKLNKQMLRQRFQEISQTEDVTDIWNIKAAKHRQERLVQYAIRSLAYLEPTNKLEVNEWFSKEDDLFSNLVIAKNLLEIGDFVGMEEQLQDISNSESIDATEAIEVMGYASLLSLYKSLLEDQRSYTELTSQEMDIMINLAESGLRYSSNEARYFMNNFFEYSYSRIQFPQKEIENIYFKEGLESRSIKEDKNLFELYPNPSNGAVWMQNRSEDVMQIRMYNTQGKEVFSDYIPDQNTLKIDLQMPAGIYYYEILDRSKQLILSNKVLLID